MPIPDGSSHAHGRSACRPKPKGPVILSDNDTGHGLGTEAMHSFKSNRELSPSQIPDLGCGSLPAWGPGDVEYSFADMAAEQSDDRDSDSAYHSPPPAPGSQTPRPFGRIGGTMSGSEDGSQCETRGASPVSEAVLLTRSNTQITAFTPEDRSSPFTPPFYSQDHRPLTQPLNTCHILDACATWATPLHFSEVSGNSQLPWPAPSMTDWQNFNCNYPAAVRHSAHQEYGQSFSGTHIPQKSDIHFGVSERHAYDTTQDHIPQAVGLCRESSRAPNVLQLGETDTSHVVQTSVKDASSNRQFESGSKDVAISSNTEHSVAADIIERTENCVGTDRGSFDCHSASSESEFSSDESDVDSPDEATASPSSAQDDILQTLLEERKKKVVDQVMEHFWDLFKKLELECPRSPSTLSDGYDDDEDDDADSTISSASEISEALVCIESGPQGNGSFREWDMRRCGHGTAPADTGEGSREAGESSSSNIGGSFSSSSSSLQGKRKADDVEPPGGQGSDGSKKQKPDPSGDPGSPSQSGRIRRLGCPYYKRQIMRGEREPLKGTSCVYPGFSTISRMKEHLYRHHKRPIHCPRCFDKFPSDQQLREHLNADVICERVSNPPIMGGFDQEQEVKLKSKARGRGIVDLEQKWRAVYKILFPGDPEAAYPNPYCEHEQGDAPSSPNSEKLAQFDAYSQQVLPGLVREWLETAVDRDNGVLQENLMSDLPNIVRDFQRVISTTFRQGAGTPAQTHEVDYRRIQQPSRAASGQATALRENDIVPEVVQAPTPIADEGTSNLPTIEETRLSRGSAESPKPETDSGYGPSIHYGQRILTREASGPSQRTPRVDRNNTRLQRPHNFMVPAQYPNVDQMNQQAYGAFAQASQEQTPQRPNTSTVASMFTPEPRYNSFDSIQLDCWNSNSQLPHTNFYQPSYSASSDMTWSTSTPHSPFDFTPGMRFSAPFQPQVSAEQNTDTPFSDGSSIPYQDQYDGRS